MTLPLRLLGLLALLALTTGPVWAQPGIPQGGAPNQSLPVRCVDVTGTAFEACGGSGGAVDTELPAAAALSDNFANPTAPAVGAFSLIWDGATWDRWTGAVTQGGTWNLGTLTTLTSVTNPVQVIGDVAHDAGAGAVDPVLTGCYASAAAPSDVSADADATREWCLRNGARAVQPTFAGVLQSTGNGTAGTGTPRVTIASDNTAFTVNIGTFPDNEPVNVAQMNGVAVTMGNGAAGTGVQRVTIANDSTGTLIATQATAANLNVRPDTSGATGAAPPARAALSGGITSGATGGFTTGITVCDSFANVNVSTATTTLIVTGVSGRHVRICAMNLVTAAANNVAIISGTGATCGTGTTGMTGGTTAATGYNFAANGGLAQGSGVGEINRTNATGDSVCVITSAATQLSGRLSYAIY